MCKNEFKNESWGGSGLILLLIVIWTLPLQVIFKTTTPREPNFLVVVVRTCGYSPTTSFYMLPHGAVVSVQQSNTQRRRRNCTFHSQLMKRYEKCSAIN